MNLDAAQRDSETVWLELSWGHWCDDLKVPDWSLFEDVSDALRGLSPADLGELGCTYHRYGIKVWLGPATKAPRGHYEAQVIGPQYVPEAAALAIEVGFHSEHPEEADNEAVIAALGRVRTVVGVPHHETPAPTYSDWRAGSTQRASSPSQQSSGPVTLSTGEGSSQLRREAHHRFSHPARDRGRWGPKL